MKQHKHFHSKPQQGSIIVYVLVAIVLLAIIGSIASLVTTQTKITSRQTHLAKAYQFADGGASIASYDLNNAFKLNSNAINTGLTSGATNNPNNIPNIPPYTLDAKLSTVSENCYVRTIAAGAPFANQAVSAQIWLKKQDDGTARVVAEATSGGVTQTATVHLMMSYGFGAAIISTAQGTSSTTESKGSAQEGNVVPIGGVHVEGGILANGSVNEDKDFSQNNGDILDQQYITTDRIPNYTDPGSADQLFDFDRFIAVADEMLPKTTHYSVYEFQQAIKAAQVKNGGKGYLEGIIVVDIEVSDDSIVNYSDVALP